MTCCCFQDCARVLRKCEREKRPISLRVNTVPLHESVAKLRAHHADNNWVDAHMEAAWSDALQKGEFCVFELFHGDTLVAADFGHVVAGGSFYVATRYHSKESTVSPGFVLAFLEARYLRSIGFNIWDLGQTDANPMM